MALPRGVLGSGIGSKAISRADAVIGDPEVSVVAIVTPDYEVTLRHRGELYPRAAE